MNDEKSVGSKQLSCLILVIGFYCYCRTCFSMGDLGEQVSVRLFVRPSVRQHLPWVSCERNSCYSYIKLFILVGWGRSFFVCCLAHRGSTVGFLLLQWSSVVVWHPRDLQVSVATCFCRVLIFASSEYLSVIYLFHVMIHWWVRKPPRGPNNCMFWAMIGAEGEVGCP